MPFDLQPIVLSTTADGWHQVMLQSGDTGYVSALFTDKQPFGQPLGTTNEQGILVTDKLAVVPSVIEIAAVTVDGASTSTTLKVVPFQYDRSEQVATGVT